MKKVLLCGYMGSGKSTIGKNLADILGLPFLDLDAVIEQETQKTIPELFNEKGELYFRKIEHNTFTRLMESGANFVLSLGGGTPAYANNHLMLNKEGVVSFYLRTSIETLYNRLSVEHENRPLISGKSPSEMKELIAKNLFDRSFFYHQATHVIGADGKSVQELSEEIVRKLT